MNDESLQKSLESIAQHNIPGNTNLWPRLAARLEHNRPFPTRLQRKIIWTILLVLLGLSAVTGVVYALGKMTGYIPGIGFVQNNSLRVLDEPVSQTRAGITISIEQVIVDSERTVIVYKTEGLTIEAANSKGEGAAFGSTHVLQLPDGTALEETPDAGYAGTPEPLIDNLHPQGGWPNYVRRLVYPRLPAEVNQGTLLIPILQTMPAGAAPENWELIFRLRPAPADMTLAPVNAVSRPAEVTPMRAGTAVPASSSAVASARITLHLDSVIELADGFVFTGNLFWDDSVFPTGNGLISLDLAPKLTDSNNADIPIEPVPLTNGSFNEHTLTWSYHTNQKNFSGPLIFSIPSLNATLLPAQVDFELELGTAPKPGQTWEINRTFLLGGHTIRLLSAQLVEDTNPCWKSDLRFKFTTDTAGISATVNDRLPETALEQTCSGGGGGGGEPEDPQSFYTGVTYASIPSGLHRFSISSAIPYLITGPWMVTWSPPAIEAATATAEPDACLTREKWDHLQTENLPLPSGLGGEILTTTDEGGLLPAINASSMDGKNAERIVTGAWPALSPDGTRLAYSTSDGLHILELASGQDIALGLDGHNLVWSPDGKHILFSTTFNLDVINSDGSGLQKLDTSPAQIVTSVGWLPNHTIVYSGLGGDGFTFTTYDLQSSQTRPLFTFQNKAGYGSVSADGQWLVFSDRVFGAQNWGIFIARLDGTQRRLVAEPEVPTAFISLWGPVSATKPAEQWLILNTQASDGTRTALLVNPFTCEAVRLSNLNAMVEGWSP